MNALPLDIKRAIRQAIRDTRERFIEGRYPYTYAADFLRAHKEIIPEEVRERVAIVDSRADAARAKEQWARHLGVDERVLAEELANAYLVESGIERDLP